MRKLIKAFSRRRKSDDSSVTSESTTKDDYRKIKVISPTGRTVTLQVALNLKLIDLKKQALELLAQTPGNLPYYTTEIKQLYLRYRLLRIDSAEPLEEQQTIENANITENEMILLNVKRTNLSNNFETLHGPTEEEIENATKDVKLVETVPPRVDINEIVLQSDLQFDVRKVLISLAQSSAYVIGAGPYASRLITMLRQRILNKKKHQNDTVQCLVDMGFSQEKVLFALKMHNGVYSAALDWLVEHQSGSNEVQDEVSSQMTASSSKSYHGNNSTENIEALLDIVRIYSHRDMPPSREMINALVDMGFTEPEVLKALKATGNNQSAACEWLCGNRNLSLMELREGLSPDSPILRAMMESPQVQMSLNNPKIFIAYLSMLDNQNALTMWLGDTDTSSVLSHILRKYHEEKHILGINQFNAVR